MNTNEERQQLLPGDAIRYEWEGGVSHGIFLRYFDLDRATVVWDDQTQSIVDLSDLERV